MTNREIALLIWLALFIAWASTVPSIRKGFASVVRHLLNYKLIVLFSIVPLFTLIIYTLISGDNYNQLVVKLCIAWTAFSGFPSLIKFPKIISGELGLESVTLNHLKYSSVAVVLVNTTSFSLWIEVGLMFFAILFPIIIAFTKVTDGNHQVISFFTRLLSMIGVLYFGCFLSEVWSNPSEFFSYSTLFKLFLPFALSAVFIPVLWGISMYSSIEDQLIRNKALLNGKPELSKHLNWVTKTKFWFDRGGINRFNRQLWRENKLSKRIINQILKEVKNGKS